MQGSARMTGRRIAATILIGSLTATTAALVAAPLHHDRSVAPEARTARAAPAPHAAAPHATPAAKPVVAPAPAAAAEPLVIRQVIDTGGPIRYGSYFWNDAAAAGPGPLTITVDVKASVLSVFRGGDEIGTAAIIYGNEGKETPIGTFPIMAKDRHHVSNLYHAPMPYMLRLTADGVSIHESAVAADYATHGCIGVPAGFAAKLFAVAKVGDRVIVTKRGLVSGASKEEASRAA